MAIEEGGRFMALDMRGTFSGHAVLRGAPQPARSDEDVGLRANWGERIVTIAATGLAVLVVALIAVLMGMA
jgi:hypothetical protein